MDMDELMSLLVKDESPSEVSDAIKDQLFSRTAEKIQNIRPQVAASVFDGDIDFDSEEGEVEFNNDVELELDPETEIE
jgi:hypothetical protein|tara:strand:+ start:1485 stop:1718 length:234 start_codon:yes stop_codon:yes gene_type:complete